jgi:hypothetical protein
VGPREPLIIDGAEAVHLACYVRASGAAEPVAHFLQRHLKPVCHTCLAGALGITFEHAKKATAALRLGSQVRIDIGRACSQCREERVTVQFDTRVQRRPLSRRRSDLPPPREASGGGVA